MIGTTNSIRDTREGKGSSPCHWRSPGSLPRENSNLGVACWGKACGGGGDRLILGALKSAFYIILIDSERSLSTITVPYVPICFIFKCIIRLVYQAKVLRNKYHVNIIDSEQLARRCFSLVTRASLRTSADRRQQWVMKAQSWEAPSKSTDPARHIYY